MHDGWRDRPARLWVVGLAALLAVGSWRLARAVEAERAARVSQDQPEPPATQPTSAPAVPETQPAEETGWPASLTSGLIGSKHDFTHGGRSGRDLCLPCHTPHLVGAPRPRLDRRAATTQPLRPYQGLDVELSGWSLLCLGCHDGVTAPDVYSSQHAILVGSEFAGVAFGSRGLRSHPVGVVYAADLATYEKYNPAAAVEAGGLLLPDGRIQCTTCHDAHNTYRHTGMLRISDERSRLCLTCHRL